MIDKYDIWYPGQDTGRSFSFLGQAKKKFDIFDKFRTAQPRRLDGECLDMMFGVRRHQAAHNGVEVGDIL